MCSSNDYYEFHEAEFDYDGYAAASAETWYDYPYGPVFDEEYERDLEREYAMWAAWEPGDDYDEYDIEFVLEALDAESEAVFEAVERKVGPLGKQTMRRSFDVDEGATYENYSKKRTQKQTNRNRREQRRFRERE